MAEVSTSTRSEIVAKKPRGLAATLSGNALAGLVRVAINALVALALPAYLTHHLPVTTYGAWVLILQLAAYVSFLDFGVQTGVAKFVAEYDARGDGVGAGRHASAGMAMMTLAGLLGLAMTLILAWQVPRLFHGMPAALFRDVRISVVLVGSSLSFGLVCSVFSAVFLGLQRYSVPTAITIVNRVSYTAAVLATVWLHGSLAAMGAVVALINVATGLLQVVLCRRLAGTVRVSLRDMERPVMKKMLDYCMVLMIWSAAMLCISGLDVTIVGHYDFRRTAFYSIATLPNTLLLMILAAAFGPLLPAASALSTTSTPREMGQLLARTTRYTTILLFLIGLAPLVFGYPLLRLWVGEEYARNCFPLFRILIVANMLRNLCMPYSTMVVALGRQRAATFSAIAEAVVNLASSVYLASIFGAVGVAYGTLLGAVVGVGVHFAVSMRYTAGVLAVSRRELLVKSLLRPAIIAVPALLLYQTWWTVGHGATDMRLSFALVVATLLLAWFVSLNPAERHRLAKILTRQA